MTASAVRPKAEPFHWQGVDVHAYKNEGEAPFKDITRQTLFAEAAMAADLRYFEIAPGGHSTLERHEHIHAVMIFRGQGQCLVGAEVLDVGEYDLITIPPMTWHQFRAAPDAMLGFLCMVDRLRDRPLLPTAADITHLRAFPHIAQFLDT
ncbi:MAG: cupin domain-containing protein [Hyphomicrobiales bacterium]|nr:cupin domain-containing protein [Hyphomicrobiales bacterium]